MPNALLDVAAAVGMCGAATPPHPTTGGKSGERPVLLLASRCSLLLPPPHRHDDGHCHGGRDAGGILVRHGGCGAALPFGVLPVVVAGGVAGSGAVWLGEVVFLVDVQSAGGRRRPRRSSPSATPSGSNVVAAVVMCGAATPPYPTTGGKRGERPVVHLASRCSLLLPPPHRHEDGHCHGSRDFGNLLVRRGGCGAALPFGVLPVVVAGVVVGSGAVGLGDVVFLGDIKIDEGHRHPCRSSPSATPLTSNVVAFVGMCGAATVPHRATTPGREEPLVLPLGWLRNLRPPQLDGGDDGSIGGARPAATTQERGQPPCFLFRWLRDLQPLPLGGGTMVLAAAAPSGEGSWCGAEAGF